MEMVILFDEHGKVHGVYEHKGKANLDNDTYFDGRGFTTTLVVDRYYPEPQTR